MKMKVQDEEKAEIGICKQSNGLPLPLPEESDRDPSCSVSCIRGNDGKNERRSHYRKTKPVKSNSLKHLLLFKLTNFSPNAWNMVSIYIHFLTLTPKESKCSALMYHR